MEASDRAELDKAVKDAQQHARSDLLRVYCSRVATTEAALFAYLVTRALVGLADAEAAILATTAYRGEGTEANRRGCALVLPGHISARDSGMRDLENGESEDAVTKRLARDVNTALRDVCIATADIDLASLPACVAKMWEHAKHKATRLSVALLRSAIRAWAFPEDPAQPTGVGEGEGLPESEEEEAWGKHTDECENGEDIEGSDRGHESDEEPSADEQAAPPRSKSATLRRSKRRRLEVATPRAAQVTAPRRRVSSTPRTAPSTVAQLLRAFAAAYVERLPPCGYTVGLAKRPAAAADTAFHFDEFFAVQHVLASLQAEPWMRLALFPDDETLLHVPLDASLHANIDALLDETLTHKSKHDSTVIFNGASDDPDAALRCTVAFQGDAAELADSVFSAVRQTVLKEEFDSHDVLQVVGSGALWMAPNAGPQEAHLDVVPIKIAAHLAECGLLPYAVFVTGAEPRTVWLLPRGAPVRATIPPYTAALLPATMLHHGDSNDTPDPVVRLFCFLVASAWYVNDVEGETSTFRRSQDALPNNWGLVEGLHAAHALRRRPEEVREALAELTAEQ